MKSEDQQRLTEAVSCALKWHGAQTRKGSTIPYVSHLLQVAGMVLEFGGHGNQAVAALLHDAVEDTAASQGDVEQHFGKEVAAIVRDCTDTLEGDEADSKSPWRVRKERFLQHLAQVDEHSALVIACDKAHNLGSMVRDLEHHGVEYMERFSGSPTEQIWYFQEVQRLLRTKIPDALWRILERHTQRLEQLLNSAM